MSMLNLAPGALFTSHAGKVGGRGLSPALWSLLYNHSMATDGYNVAYQFGDDFMNFGAIAPAISGTTAGTSHGGYAYYVDTATSACSITQLATAVGGVVRVSNGATDNHESWLTSGGNTGVLGVISDTAGSDKVLVFETRVRVGQVTNNYNMFVGLAEEGLAAANTVTDAGALADKDLIGFAVLEADGDSLSFVYRKAGGAVQTVLSVPIAASTWYKLGFIYDPAQPASRRIRIFVDNVEQTTKVTADNIAAATFPDGEELAFLFGLKNGAATAVTADIDWVQFYQAG